MEGVKQVALSRRVRPENDAEAAQVHGHVLKSLVARKVSLSYYSR